MKSQMEIECPNLGEDYEPSLSIVQAVDRIFM